MMLGQARRDNFKQEKMPDLMEPEQRLKREHLFVLQVSCLVNRDMNRILLRMKLVEILINHLNQKSKRAIIYSL
jgi:hypothetical protein